MNSVILEIANRDKGYINLDKILELPPIASFEELVEALKNNKKVNIESLNNSNGNTQLVFSFNIMK